MSNERSPLGVHDLVASAAIHAGRVPNVAAGEVYQTSLMSALVDGIYEGKETYGDLQSQGDFGLGTFNDLDGEMVGLDGIFYQLRSDGSVRVVDDNQRTPFAIVTFFEDVADLKLAEQTMSSLLQQIAQDRAKLLDEAGNQGGNPIHPLRIIAELQKFMSPDVTLCSDMGSFSLYLSRYLTSFRARQVLISNGQQTLGVALPWAIAASIVRLAEKVLSVSGDGGFLFSAMELETAVRLKSNLLHMVWIDGSYNMVAVQEELKYGRHSGTDLGPVDVVRYAEAFGANGFQVTEADDLKTTLRKAFEIPGPVLIGVNVDYAKNAQLFEAVHHDSIL